MRNNEEKKLRQFEMSEKEKQINLKGLNSYVEMKFDA
jgi:hypothetical protein